MSYMFSLKYLIHAFTVWSLLFIVLHEILHISKSLSSTASAQPLRASWKIFEEKTIFASSIRRSSFDNFENFSPRSVRSISSPLS